MGEEKIDTIQDYCHSVITRRCRQSIDLREHPAYEEMIKDIKSKLPKTLLSHHSNIGKVIVGVGDDLFGSRPATLPYILTFLEFVSLVYKEINGQCPWIDYSSEVAVPLPIFTHSAALAIVKTALLPPLPPRPAVRLCNIL